MKKSTSKNVIELDGRTGEGGGQLVRIAVSLSALTGTPIRIHHVRGNRGGARGGGLKAQHASCVQWLAEATEAETTGCFVGSKEFEFIPKLRAGKSRTVRIDPGSAASIPLTFQAIFPFLLFADDDSSSPVTITIRGGTNVPWSLSYDYLDQVLLPSLELLGVPKVDRKVEFRGWSHGTRQIGSVKFSFTPLGPNQTLSNSWPQSTDSGSVEHIDVTIIVPRSVRDCLKAALKFELNLVFPNTEMKILVDEDSRHPARLYTLLVAHTSNGLRFGRDCVYNKSTRNRSPDDLATEIAQKVVDDLDAEVRKGVCVDEFLQDQLIIFQALAKGRSFAVDQSGEDRGSDNVEYFKCPDEPFGDGSLHTTSARWVVSQLLPGVKWINKGNTCEGLGWTLESLENDMSKLGISNSPEGSSDLS